MMENAIYETLTDVIRSGMIVFLIMVSYAAAAVGISHVKAFHRKGIARVQAWEQRESQSAIIIVFPVRKS